MMARVLRVMGSLPPDYPRLGFRSHIWFLAHEVHEDEKTFNLLLEVITNYDGEL